MTKALVLACVPWLSGCETDLNLLAPYQDTPVVYCILNPREEVQYLRLEKTFLGKGNALIMAREKDSIYYPEADVRLERWADGVMKQQFTLQQVQLPARDTGVFVNEPNYVYQCETALATGGEYRLNIFIPSTGTQLRAVTQVVNEFRAIRPEAYKKNLAFSSYDNYEPVEWVAAPYTRIYHLAVRFHYLEVIGTDTAYKSADWNIGHYITDYAAGGEDFKVEVLHRNFYKWVANRLDPPAGNMIRLANKKALDFVFTVGGEELYTYMQIYGDDAGILKEKPVFTNIENGIGLFSSRFQQSIDGKALSDASIDSLAYGMYTSQLGFGDSFNDYYLR